MQVEEKLTQQELDKLNIGPDIDFKELAKKSFDELTPNLIGMFKWSGVYHQLQTKYFMIRLRMPAGILTSEQLIRAGELAKEYGQNSLCISTRQCLQFHWIRLQDIHKILEGMEEVGIITKNACGDVCRNVTACSLQGVCKYEVGNTSKIVYALADDPVIRDQLRNLPRKHKIAVSGCKASCAQPLMNCQGWCAVERENNGKREVGWQLYAGGGLGSLPHVAKPILEWVPEEMVVPVSRAVIEIHNRYGNRRVRRFARLKIVVEEMGREKFTETLFDILREAGVENLSEIVISESHNPDIKPSPFDTQSIIPQKDENLNTVRIMIQRSELTGDEAIFFAKLAESYGNGEVVMTIRQNLELRNIPNEHLTILTQILKKEGYRLQGFEMIPDIVSCVGTTVCNLAVANVPAVYHRLLDEFADDSQLINKVGKIRINLNGCPNGCGQHWVSDIGLRGCRIRTADGSEEGVALYIGGRHDGNGAIGRFVANIAVSGVENAIRKLLDFYLEQRKKGELFADFAARCDISEVQQAISELPSALPNNKLDNIIETEIENIYTGLFNNE